jgi:hypothetical protein
MNEAMMVAATFIVAQWVIRRLKPAATNVKLFFRSV